MVYFVTDNQQKFDNAQIILKTLNLQLERKSLPITEIQSHSLEDIARDKAIQAFKQLRKPLVVKDDGWYITALNGFPGSYMRYINEWFSYDDFLRLLSAYNNREIVFKDALYYIDGETEKLFTKTIKGRILCEPKGIGVPGAMISTFRKDGMSMAECINKGIHFADSNQSVWIDFAKWYLTSK